MRAYLRDAGARCLAWREAPLSLLRRDSTRAPPHCSILCGLARRWAKPHRGLVRRSHLRRGLGLEDPKQRLPFGRRQPLEPPRRVLPHHLSEGDLRKPAEHTNTQHLPCSRARLQVAEAWRTETRQDAENRRMPRDRMSTSASPASGVRA